MTAVKAKKENKWYTHACGQWVNDAICPCSVCKPNSESKRATTNESLALVTEFRIKGKRASTLAARIDGRIRIAVAAERYRCFDIVHKALSNAEGHILEMKVKP